MLISVHDKTVIDLIRKNDQFLLSGDLRDLLQDLLRIDSTCRVIRVDDNDRFGPVRDLASDILDIWIPVRLLVTDIMYDLASCQCRSRRPQRIIRCRDQNLISIIQKCLHTQADKFTDTISCIDIIHGHIRDPAKLCILHDRLAGRKNTLGIRIAL